MRLVIDTNVLLVSISRHSALHWIWQALQQGKFERVLSNSILSEYREVFTRHNGIVFCNYVIETLESLPNKQEIQLHYEWNLISADPDDYKFVDAAIAARANYIITHDKHFDLLKTIAFPRVNVINTLVLKDLLQ